MISCCQVGCGLFNSDGYNGNCNCVGSNPITTTVECLLLLKIKPPDSLQTDN